MARIWVSQGIRSMRYRERRLSSSSRRWSKASSDGSFKANIARADMRASAREMVGLPGRGSARFSKLVWTKETKASAERCFRGKSVPTMATSQDYCWVQHKTYQVLEFTNAGYVC